MHFVGVTGTEEEEGGGDGQCGQTGQQIPGKESSPCPVFIASVCVDAAALIVCVCEWIQLH